MDDIILIILITGMISISLGIVLKKFDIPPIIGYIFSGAIIGTSITLGTGDTHTLEHIAEFGIVFLMFSIGLEIKLENLIQMKKQVFTYGGLQVALSMSIFTLIAIYVLGQNIKAALVIGGALSLSSTAIVLKLMNESNEISKGYGQNTLGMLIFQDLAVIPILLMLTILSDSSSTISTMLVDIVIDGFILIVIMILFGKYILDKVLHMVDKANAHELFIMAILIIAIGSSYLAHALGFTYSLGAFIGGMLIAETHYKHQIEADLIPFRDLFLALFFVTVGMQIDMQFFVNNILEVFGASISIMLVKGMIIFAVIYIFTNKTIALQTSLAISQVGEFSFVVFTQATQSNLLDKHTGQLLTLAVIVSMIVTPFILSRISKITNAVLKQKDTSEIVCSYKNILEDHVVVCGYGGFAKQIVNNLKQYGVKHIIIVDNYDFFENAINAKEDAIFGNPAQKNILEEAGIKKAKVVIIALHDIEDITLISHAIRSINKDIKIIAKVTNKNAFENDIDTSDFVDIYSFTSELIATQTFAILYEKKKEII